MCSKGVEGWMWVMVGTLTSTSTLDPCLGPVVSKVASLRTRLPCDRQGGGAGLALTLSLLLIQPCLWDWPSWEHQERGWGQGAAALTPDSG